MKRDRSVSFGACGASPTPDGRNQREVRFGLCSRFEQPISKQSGRGIRRLTGVLDHQVMHTELTKASGNEFDVAYIRGQVLSHLRHAQRIQSELTGSGPPL